MALDFWGFRAGPSFRLPLHPAGYLLLGAELLGLLLILWWTAPRRQALAWFRRQLQRPSVLPLALGALILAEIFVLRLPGQAVTPGLPLEAQGPSLALLGGMPWMLAAGMLGPGPAMFIGALGGLVRGAWETHSLFTPLHMAIQAGLVGALLRQDYVEWPGRAARLPVISGMAGGLLYGGLRSIENFLYCGGGFYESLDFMLSRLGTTLVAAALEAGIAGAICSWLTKQRYVDWYRPRRLRVGPYNRSLAARLITIFLVVGAISSGVLVYGDWLLAQSSAREFIERQITQAADQVAGSIPYFIQTGRSLQMQIAAETATMAESGEISQEKLDRLVRRTAFFDSLAVYDAELDLIATAPAGEVPGEGTPFEIGAALDTTLHGPPQEVVLRPLAGPGLARLAFLAPIVPEDGERIGVVVGVTSLDRNPYLMPALGILNALSPGEAFITDSNGLILAHPDAGRALQRFDLGEARLDEVVSDTAPDGSRRLLHIRPVDGYPWHVVTLIPQSEVQKVALRLAANLFAMISGVGLAVLIAVYLISRRLTRPLRTMASAAQAIARGNLSHRIQESGQDEIGRLATSFERMRQRLKARLDEMGLLLNASQQVSRSFNLEASLPDILEGLREITKADLVRVVLEGWDGSAAAGEAFSAGSDPGQWALLDPQVLRLCREKGQFSLDNPARARAVLNVEALKEPMQSLMALPLRHEGEYLGALWLGYRAPHGYRVDESQLLSILSGQLAVAVSNTRLFRRVEQERLRLAAVLETTPDAVILVDPDDRISLANPAAEAVLACRPEEALGRPADAVVMPEELRELLLEHGTDRGSAEISLDAGRTLFASVSVLRAGEAQASGRVCVLWDITHYKRLDALKSEFVSTVSHDLRAPLTLMRGYATMLTMVGAMNEQQKEFVGKILASADQMSELIENLLDLGRIEAGIELALREVPISELLESVMDAYRPQAANKQISLAVEMGDEMTPVEVDATLMRQAIANLVDNALKYTPAKGEVTLRAWQREGLQVVQVEDTGVGIAPTDQARLFERFYRARRKETLNVKGSGLGLAIVKSIVQQHQGRVSVESKLGQGSTFTIEFPIRRPAAENAEADHDTG